jgi:hypothetical protein
MAVSEREKTLMLSLYRSGVDSRTIGKAFSLKTMQVAGYLAGQARSKKSPKKKAKKATY